MVSACSYEQSEVKARPLEQIYTIVFIDVTILKIRIDGNVKNIAAYIMLGIKLDGSKEILGMLASQARYC